MSWDHDLERRLRALYGGETRANGRSHESVATATPAGDGFVTEIAGKLILTAPAGVLAVADELPTDMRQRWEKASVANPYFMWLQGRFVEAERANKNGAFWSTADLQFGEMTVKNGPLNWLHDARTVIGCIADNALVTPTSNVAVPAQAAQLTYSLDGTMPGIQPNNLVSTALSTNPVMTVASRQRPYIAAVSAVWRWIYPEQARAIEAASDAGNLWYSMECVSREMACHTDGDRIGCGRSFPYMQAMTKPETTCEHIASHSSARRMVDPAFLGGAVIIPPVRPGWGDANAQVMRQAAALAEQVAPTDANATQWEALMAGVLNYAVTS